MNIFQVTKFLLKTFFKIILINLKNCDNINLPNKLNILYCIEVYFSLKDKYAYFAYIDIRIDKNADSIYQCMYISCYIKVCLATTGVCVFYALTFGWRIFYLQILLKGGNGFLQSEKRRKIYVNEVY